MLKRVATSRYRIILGTMVILLAACAATAANSEVFWRLQVLAMKARGQVPSLGWAELVWDLRPHSPVYLRLLTTVPNAELAILNPYTAPEDSAAGANAFRRSCSSCHGVDAKSGRSGPNLVSGHSLTGGSDWALYRTIARGVPETAMRGHNLPPRTIWQLVDYIQRLRSGDTLTGPAGPAISVPFSKLLKSADDSTSWYTYSGDYRSNRYSRLSTINTRTVHRLRVAWQYQSGSTELKFESTPLAIGGLLYFTEPPGNVVAVDAVDGSVRWRYTRTIPDGISMCCGAINRGLAALDSLLYVGTLDAHLIALNARNGLVVWDHVVADWHDGYSITGAPLAVKSEIVTGVAGGDFGARGFLAAVDARTGNEKWRFWTVPAPGEKGFETWGGDSWKHGGSPTWLTGSYDSDQNLLFWGVGNPAPDFRGDERGGDNLYSNSVLALDADSGTLRWHFQFTPHDEHDWDAVQIPVLLDGRFKGEQRSLVAWANRNAFYYLLDRKTGRFLVAQPFARQTWAAGIDSVSGRPRVRPSSHPSHDGSLVYPQVDGATNWWSPTYSPRTGLFYVPVLEGGSVVYADRTNYESGELYMGSVNQLPHETTSLVRAIDPFTGRIKWEHAFETGSHRLGLGGLLSVAGDLVFAGSDRVFYALDARTGDVLWRFNAGGQIVAAPITFMNNGKQYVAVAAGRSLIAFALEETTQR